MLAAETQQGVQSGTTAPSDSTGVEACTVCSLWQNYTKPQGPGDPSNLGYLRIFQEELENSLGTVTTLDGLGFSLKQ